MSNQVKLVESKRENRKRELRARITDSATALFAARGFAETTIDDICEAADVARRTLYTYFPTKHEIIRSLCRSLIIDEAINTISLAIERHDDIRSRLRFLFSRMNENMNTPDPLRKALIQQLVSDQSQSNDSNHLLLGDLKNAFNDLFESAIDANGLSKTMGPSLSSEIVISIISAHSVNWLNDQNYPSTKNLAEIEKYLINNMA